MRAVARRFAVSVSVVSSVQSMEALPGDRPVQETGSRSSGDVEEAVEEAVGGQQPSSRTATSAFVQGGTGGALPEPCKMTSSKNGRSAQVSTTPCMGGHEGPENDSMMWYRDEILRPLVRPYAGAVGPGFLLMQDNARPHVAGVCQQFLQDEGIDAMDWPARSPDLNPIEHIWDIMSRSIHQRHVAPQTVQELADALVQVWEEIPQETIRHLIRSMPRHCREVIQARGGHTHY
ncbi:hypothetical protein L3Q82_011437 [Scortum barcoo]|uniref:Uncharacterized protein n=1 Tax=Scortum barcoo TaxID=214431 RepID=A0ACB8WAB7_9TELE|nr:hypothetical protein L3Q82_011437 [Scortum barcoo]